MNRFSPTLIQFKHGWDDLISFLPFWNLKVEAWELRNICQHFGKAELCLSGLPLGVWHTRSRTCFAGLPQSWNFGQVEMRPCGSWSTLDAEPLGVHACCWESSVLVLLFSHRLDSSLFQSTFSCTFFGGLLEPDHWSRALVAVVPCSVEGGVNISQFSQCSSNHKMLFQFRFMTVQSSRVCVFNASQTIIETVKLFFFSCGCDTCPSGTKYSTGSSQKPV